MVSRADDWFRQAVRDLEHATESRTAGRREWACFAAHQAAEKAVNALHLHRGQEARGPVVARLLAELPPDVDVAPGMIDAAKVLDNAYIPSRYPNSHPSGPPFEHYGPLQSEEALKHAGAIIAFVRAAMA